MPGGPGAAPPPAAQTTAGRAAGGKARGQKGREAASGRRLSAAGSSAPSSGAVACVNVRAQGYARDSQSVAAAAAPVVHCRCRLLSGELPKRGRPDPPATPPAPPQTCSRWMAGSFSSRRSAPICILTRPRWQVEVRLGHALVPGPLPADGWLKQRPCQGAAVCTCSVAADNGLQSKPRPIWAPSRTCLQGVACDGARQQAGPEDAPQLLKKHVCTMVAQRCV